METVNFWDAIAVILSAIIGSMGLGGGSVLILYLTLIKHTEQLAAQGINLLFFLPCAVTAVCIYRKQKIIQWKTVLPMVFGGLGGVLIGYLLLNYIGTKYITILFAGFLILVGTITFFQKEKKA